MRRQLAVMTKILIDRTEAMGYDVKPGSTWGAACRPIGNTSKPSDHSKGKAIDINAPRNPYASAAWHRRNAGKARSDTLPFGMRVVTDIPESVIRLWEAYGWYWGGRYRSHPDGMHFSYMGSEADAARHTAQLQGGRPSVPSIPIKPGDSPEMNRAEQEQMDRIEAMLTGKVENSLRHYIRDQDIATRKIIEDDGEKTRLGTLKVVVESGADIKSSVQKMLDVLYVKIKKLAG